MTIANTTTIRRLVLEGTEPSSWGRQHGESLRAEIRNAYEVRLELVLQKTDLRDAEEALALCRLHEPVLAHFDVALHEEMNGIATGAGLTLSQIILLNHYTDLRDLRRQHLQEAETSRADDGDQGCSVIYAPGDSGLLLGQTWDMHGSATDFVWLLEVPTPSIDDDGSPSDGKTLLFTLAGCVGMTGLTSWGLGMTINNLNSLDARIGIVWPALVRRTLRCATAQEARDVILQSPLGSGHHYVVADGQDLFGIETSGTQKKLTQQGIDRIHLHTNHCLDDDMKTTCRILPTSTTESRYQTLTQKTRAQPVNSLSDMWSMLTSVSHPRDAQEAHAVATCGAFCMNLSSRVVWACQGPPALAPEAGSPPQRFDLRQNSETP